MEILKFRVGDIRCALQLEGVVAVELAAELTPLPGAPSSVSGCLNYHGEIIPVIGLATLLSLPSKPIRLEDRFIVVKSSRRTLALWVDAVEARIDSIETVKKIAVDIAEGISHLSGVCRIEGDIFYINDIESFLSNEDESLVEEALDSLNS